MIFRREHIQDLARGAAFLGAGGGGDPYVGCMLLEQAMLTTPEIRIISVDEVPDDALVVPTAMMGAPTVLIEKLPNGDEARLALQRMEQEVGRPAFAVMPGEIGGLAALLPLVLAARTGLPVVDADAIGRAVPALQMTSFHVHGLPASPVTLADVHGNSAVVRAKDDQSSEWLARSISVAMGATCQFCFCPMTGAELRRGAVRDTITNAIGIGRAIRLARAEKSGAVDGLLNYLRGTEHYRWATLLYDGKVVDLKRETRAGWAVGTIKMEPIAPFEGKLEVVFQNEHLIVRQDGQMKASVPDVIALLDRETAQPITTEGVRYGQRLKVVATSSPAVMRTPAGLEVIGPRAFGFEEDFVPVEVLNSLQGPA